MLGGRAKDAVVLRQVALGKRGHNAARAGTEDAQHHLVADRGRTVEPGVLDETGLSGRLDHDVWAETSHLESALRVKLTQLVDGRSRENVHGPEVEECIL